MGKHAYDAYKTFEGRRYTGMKVGGRHKWHYEAGEWNEKKVAPDRWEFTYAVPKRRHGKAPVGSGRAGRDGVPLVHPRASDRAQARRERVHDGDERAEVQARAQARGEP